MTDIYSQSGLTTQAASKVFSLMTEEGNLDLKLRVYIQGGGCSGFQYGFSFEENPQEDDFILTKDLLQLDCSGCELDLNNLIILHDFIENLFLVNFNVFFLPFLQKLSSFMLSSVIVKTNTVSLLIDSISHQYLNGATIDYKTGVDGEYFAVNNPNAKTTCGCGSSFAV
jgi:iron-sulfur cluster insertion protein